VAEAGDKDCADFDTQNEAQNFFESHNPNQDPHNLDGDGDGQACETLPGGGGGGGRGGGGGGGGGGHPPPAPDNTQAGRVIEVTDGDTIEVRTQGKRRDVRLIGIDTPEVSGGQECGGTRLPNRWGDCFRTERTSRSSETARKTTATGSAACFVT
jgi:Excalibur calcium-binding domain